MECWRNITVQIYQLKKEAHEQELRQQRDTAHVRIQESRTKAQHSSPSAANETTTSETRYQHGPVEPALRSPHGDIQQVNAKEQSAQVPLSHMPSGHSRKHAQPTLSSSMPLTKSNVLHTSKQPQSFPDRLALIQKQKEKEEFKTSARSSIRALKVSNG